MNHLMIHLLGAVILCACSPGPVHAQDPRAERAERERLVKEAQASLRGVKSSAELFDLLDLLPEAAPIELAKVSLRSAMAPSGELSRIQMLAGGEEFAYPAVDGTIGIYHIASGDRRRAVYPAKRRKKNPVPPEFVIDPHQRRVAVVEDRAVEVMEFPVIARVDDFRMSKGVVAEMKTMAFFGKAYFSVPGANSIRITSHRKTKIVKLGSRPVSTRGDPTANELRIWSAEPVEGADPEDDAALATWRLFLLTGEDGKWGTKEIVSLDTPMPSNTPVHWSGDGKRVLLQLDSKLLVLSPIRGETMLEVPADSTLDVEGVTPTGSHVIVRIDDGLRVAHRLAEGFPALGSFTIPVPEGATAAQYDSASDRWVSVSEDRKTIHVFGPPGCKVWGGK